MHTDSNVGVSGFGFSDEGLPPGSGEDRLDKDDAQLLWAVRQDLFVLGYVALGPSKVLSRKTPMDAALRAAIVDFRSLRRLSAFVVVDEALLSEIQSAIRDLRGLRTESAVGRLLRARAEEEEKKQHKAGSAGLVLLVVGALWLLRR